MTDRKDSNESFTSRTQREVGRAAVAVEDERVARKLWRLISAAETTVEDVMHAVGKHRTKLYRFADGRERLSAGALWCLPVPLRRALADDLAQSCGLETRPVSESTPDAHVTALKEIADVIRATATTMADGEIDAREAPELLAEIAEAQEAMSALAAMVRESQAKVRRIGGAA